MKLGLVFPTQQMRRLATHSLITIPRTNILICNESKLKALGIVLSISQSCYLNLTRIPLQLGLKSFIL